MKAFTHHTTCVQALFWVGLFSIPFIVCIGGCSTNSTIRTSEGLTGQTDVAFHFQMQTSTASIQLRDGRQFDGSGVRIERDSLFWDVSQGRIGVPLTDVERVSGKNHVNGFLEGGFLGFLGGALVGAGLGLAADDENVGHPDIGNPLVLGFLGGILGGVGGLVVGGIQGHTYTYEFSNDQ